MYNKTFTIDLNNGSGFSDCAKFLRDTATDIDSKLELICEKLADIGITVANQNVGDDYSSYIEFRKQITDKSEGNVTIVMYAENIGTLIKTWLTKNGTRSEEVNAVMMNEVGSGWFAENPDGLANAGQGTFPNQKHAFDKNGWYWNDGSGTQHSYGENGHLSMHKAYISMQQEVGRVVSEVFK